MTSSTRALSLVSNGFALEQSAERLGWLEATEPSVALEQQRALYKKRGYLWLKGVLKRDDVLTFRDRFFEALRTTGLLAEGSKAVDGIYSGGPVQKELAHRIFMEAHRWPEYEVFCASFEIVSFYEKFLGGEVHLHKRKLIRYDTPDERHCTGAHYDLIYLRGGSDRLCSSWIPLGDTPVEMGGLVYLEGSDALGRRMEAEFSRQNADLPPEERVSAYNRNMRTGWLTNNLTELAQKSNGRWLIADYEAGDMVVHSPYMIHAATQNYDPQGRIRLSTDIRYQLKSEKIDPRWGNHYFLGDNL